MKRFLIILLLTICTISAEIRNKAQAFPDISYFSPRNQQDITPRFTRLIKSHFNPIAYGDATRIIFSNGISFDTKLLGKNCEPPLPGELTTHYADDETGYYIIQFSGPIYGQEKEYLEKNDIKIHFYIPNYGFVVTLKDKAQRDAIISNPSVNWLGIYQPAYKISTLFNHIDSRHRVTFLLFMDADIDSVLSEIKGITGEGDFIISDNGINKIIQGEIYEKDVNILAHIKGVYWIEPYLQPQLCNIDIQWILQDCQPNVRNIWNKGIMGEGEIVNLLDTGIYTTHYTHCSGSPPIPNFGYYPFHNAIVAYDSAGPNCVFGGSQHGTFTAGTLTGDDTLTPGNSLYDGIAKRSRLYHLQFGRSGNTLTLWPDLNDVYIRPYNLYYPPTRAHISSNPWGVSNAGVYDSYCLQVDQFTWGHRDFLTLFAVGNNGPYPRSVISPASAKNVIAVGATGNRETGYTQYFSFNSRGPTVDGRLKPMVLSPGGPVTSAGSPPNGYTTLQGTSVATPGAAGAGALIRQYLNEGWYPTGKKIPENGWEYISSAMVKAILINCADTNINQGTFGYIPNNNLGWGRIDLDSTLYFAGDLRKVLLYDDTIGLMTGEAKDFYFNIPSGSANLKITLVWTDYPGNPVVLKQLVNDLDLYVQSPSGIYYRGNQYSDGQSIPNPSNRDTLNVEECVRVDNPSQGEWLIRIEARNVVYGPQPFALVLTYTAPEIANLISLNKPVYRINDFITDTVRIRVEDQNYGTTGIIDTLLVMIKGRYIETQPETLRCVELAESSFVFKCEIPLSFRGAVHNDGKLSVCQGDTIYAFYIDENPPSISSAWASVDAWYFIISDVHCENIDATGVDVCWTTNEGANSKVYYGTDPNNLNLVVSVDKLYVTFHRVRLSGLEEQTTYYYDVESRDFRGNRVFDNNNGLHYTFTTEQARGNDVLIVVLNNQGMEFAHPEFLRNAINEGAWIYNWWSTRDQGDFTRDDLKWYKVVFFQVGQENYPVWTIAQKETIKLYHDGGARFAMTGHDIGFDTWQYSRVDTLFAKDYLHFRYIGDITSNSWNTLMGIAGDPISGNYTGGVPYQPFRYGAVGDSIQLSGTGAPGTGFYVWHGSAANDSCGIRWESQNPMGTPGDGVWGGHRTRVVTNCFEITQIDTTNQNSPIRNNIINNTLIWLIGHDHPDVVIHSPVSDTTYNTSPILISWDASAYGGAEIDTTYIEYSPDNGNTWYLIIADTGLVGYLWDVSNIQNGDRYRIRITVNDKGVYPELKARAETGNFRINISGNDHIGPKVIPNSIVVENNPKFVTQSDTLLGFTAIVSDSQTGLSIISSAVYNARSPSGDSSGEVGMQVSDGVWDEVIEDVNGLIRMVYIPGAVNVCSLFVRSRDTLQNWGAWYYRTFTLIDGDIRQGTGIKETKTSIPLSFSLSKPMPNPFRNKVIIRYTIQDTRYRIGENRVANIKIFDISGRLVKQFNNLTIQPFNQVIWDGTDDSGRKLPSGVYFIRLETDGFKKNEKVILLR